MVRFWQRSAAALLASTVLGVGTLLAQAPQGGYAPPPPPGGAYYSRPPAFSPYLNLLRGGGSATLNYYGLVRPEMQFRQSIQNLSGDVAMNQQMLGTLGTEVIGLPSTGHPTQFMNLGGYFMNSGGGMGASILGTGNPRSGAGTMNLTGPTGQTGTGAQGSTTSPPRRR
jgi:hypothetical protein